MTSVAMIRCQTNVTPFTLFPFLVLAGYSVTSTLHSPLLPGYPGSTLFPRLVLVTMGIICIFGIARSLMTASTLAADEVLTIPVGNPTGDVISTLPLILGFVMGPIIEKYLGRAPIINRGDLGAVVSSPIAATLLTVCVVAAVWYYIRTARQKRAEAEATAASDKNATGERG